MPLLDPRVTLPPATQFPQQPLMDPQSLAMIQRRMLGTVPQGLLDTSNAPAGLLGPSAVRPGAAAGLLTPIGGERMAGGGVDPARLVRLLNAPEYQTPLTAGQEIDYQLWKMVNAPHDSGEDYDLRGAFLQNFGRAANGHMGDQFKKPNHPTFSNQSQYAAASPYTAGHWGGPEMGDGSIQTQSYIPSFIAQLLGKGP